MDNINLSIIIPAYREEENLRLILPRLMSVVNKLGVKSEVLIIDTTKPTDNTRLVCEANGAIYINRRYGNDYGDAIITGIREARGENTVIMDADGSHSPEFVSTLYKYKQDYDVVISSRYIDGGSTDNTRTLIMLSYITNVTYSIVLNLNYRDISNSFRLYNTKQLKQLTLKCKNFDIVEEILYKLKKTNPGIRIIEIPGTFKERMFGHTKRNLYLFVISYIVTLIKLRFDL